MSEKAIRTTTRTWPSASRPKPPARFSSTRSPTPANPFAHETTAGPEIWQQMEHDVDAVVVGVGSGGTLTGLGRFFRRVSPDTQMVLADPAGSILAPLVKTGKMT